MFNITYLFRGRARMGTWRRTPKPSLFYPIDLDRVIPAQVVQRKMASVISIKSENVISGKFGIFERICF